jgi:hypothetical protein
MTLNSKELESRYWNIFHDEVVKHNLEIHPNCERLVKELITNGAEELIRADQLYGVTDSNMDEAQKNIQLFAQSMIAEAVAEGSNLLHEDIFSSVSFKLCPLWPFC